eukprot:6264918-Prorocentrum_lima.AAC.1
MLGAPCGPQPAGVGGHPVALNPGSVRRPPGAPCGPHPVHRPFDAVVFRVMAPDGCGLSG